MQSVADWLEKRFQLREYGTDIRTEVVAGITTFLTMCYIILVNPVILKAAGMDEGAVMVATCLVSAVPTILMAFLANYPVACAPGMGHNALFAFWVCSTAPGGLGLPWQAGLACVFLSGVLFVLLSGVGFREAIIDAIPESLKHAIAVGIGLFITLIGLEWGGLVVASEATLVTIAHQTLTSTPTLACLFGLLVTICLLALGVRAAILIGLLASGILGILTGVTKFQGVIALPPSLAPTAFQLSFAPLLALGAQSVLVVLILFLLDVFDTVGTLIGVSAQAGLLRNGKLPRAREALLSDAIGTTLAGLLGSSTVTAYIESATGVQAGGRTGLTALVVGILMLSGLFFSPLVAMLSVTVMFGKVAGHPLIAPALITVGAFMMTGVRHIPWDDLTEAFPAFLTIALIPFGFSIADGIGFGFITYALLKLVTRRAHEASWLLYLLAVFFLAMFLARTFMAG
ncbi:Guanine/hypoxanthine permease PbuG [bacterium HR17]|uniref:Guanine/hypoxanthine permease PbuG n=1 Tax=Candidatus Fervidibacter japonicus TaxID=2035412 RepID=A0A2H5XB03_9BACT|nr:Guanine/hypoxanthine permease PbuG [bacterium HR17]